ncbi:MAG: hypothetical protein DLM67_26735 [Candidatus Nephthysia bennettiae]|uniref:DUF6917 domain-containing protein n=1 Tax=Candidatus Nephthysia bennettiae TaxID=3127016 RepID=A0A934KDM0_9BACT|nr:hypothetical protein [Candidatus Dormibacteraeota bacterium]PZR84944.1 MAG: hypothetical protein DLM67_26735 [Candidatus Dormibacteraeota bacterium]
MTARIEPHAGGVLDNDYPYTDKRTVEGHLVCVLGARADDRRLELTVHPSRAVRCHEIHEVLMVEDPEAAPTRTVGRVAYAGCVEIARGGMILIHDRVVVAGRDIGTVVGFDETHLPNHMNIAVLAAGELRNGEELGLEINDSVSFVMGDGYRRERLERTLARLD